MNTGKKIEWNVLDNGCWECISHSTDNSGYPRLTRKGKLEQMSRYFYKKYNGDLCNNEIVRHTCDFPKCINPKHLVKGNFFDNMRDRDSRGRTARGEKHGFARLNESQVLEIKNNPLISMAYYARKFGVAHSTVKSIRHGLTWKHL